MTSPPPFCKILNGADGIQVLFVLDKVEGLERLQAVTPNGDGDLTSHNISFDVPGTAYKMFCAVGQEQADIMRRVAMAGKSGNADLLNSLCSTLQ